MSTKNNKTDGSEVESKIDETAKSEVISKGPITGQEAINDMLSEGSDAPAKEAEPTPEAEKKGGEDDGKSPDEKKESKPEVEPEPEKKEEPENVPDETFAKVGDQVFKTKEDLLKFTQSNIGYNSWLTGQVKRLHPDWFGVDGSLKTKELEQAVSAAGKKMEKAAETVAELSDTPADELTDEQKDDIKKAREILRPIGVIFRDDPFFQSLEERLKILDDQVADDAQTVVGAFRDKHPVASAYSEPFAKFIESRQYTDIEKAWKVYKIENEIEEPEADSPNPGGPKKLVDTALPAKINKEGGTAPIKKEEKDLMDEILSTPRL